MDRCAPSLPTRSKYKEGPGEVTTSTISVRHETGVQHFRVDEQYISLHVTSHALMCLVRRAFGCRVNTALPHAHDVWCHPHRHSRATWTRVTLRRRRHGRRQRVLHCDDAVTVAQASAAGTSDASSAASWGDLRRQRLGTGALLRRAAGLAFGVRAESGRVAEEDEQERDHREGGEDPAEGDTCPRKGTTTRDVRERSKKESSPRKGSITTRDERERRQDGGESRVF